VLRKHKITSDRLLLDAETESYSLYADYKINDLFLQRPVYKHILEDKAFQRLKRISFLGAIDYILPRFRKSTSLGFRSRFQHSLGVAKLALRFAVKTQLDEHDEKLVVLAALLHDIGHAPLSHSLEPVFKSYFSIGHHEASANIIKGSSPLGKGVLEILRSNHVDPEEIIALLSGKHKREFVHLFASPMNIDTFEGILRCYLYMGAKLSLSPDRLLDSVLSINAHSQSYFDEFWKTKQYVYQYLINSSVGVYADAETRRCMIDNIVSFNKNDYYISEDIFLKKHPEIRRALHNAQYAIRSKSMDSIPYSKRVFTYNSNQLIRSCSDIYIRYIQIKTTAFIKIPSTLVCDMEPMQCYLFENASTQ
jgi:uncharacterized protein